MNQPGALEGKCNRLIKFFTTGAQGKPRFPLDLLRAPHQIFVSTLLEYKDVVLDALHCSIK